MAGKKKNPNAKYAVIGLVVALIACISTGLLGFANLLGSIGMFPLPENIQDGVNLSLQISIGLLIIGLAAYAILNPDAVRRFLTGRQARYGSNSLILTIAFVGVLIAVNYIVFQNTDLFGSPYDFTEDKSNTLAPETLQILATLDEPVLATAFFSSNSSSSSAEELLQKFKNNSEGKFNYDVVNTDLDPVLAREAGVTGEGKILLQMGETKEIASFASETELARALLRLISPGSRTVYFLQGHGEISLEGGAELAYTVVKSTLEAKNYTVNTLNLLTTREIPEDALAIIIAGPQKPVSKDEVDLLKKYVDNGGALIVLQDPNFFTEFGDASDPLANYLVGEWGISYNDDVVIDGVNTQNPFAAISSLYNPSHPITQNLTENLFVIMPQARSLSISSEKENILQTWLISTTENSWGETQLSTDGSETPQFDAESDVPGPLYLAIAAENSATSGRVVVFGNSLFAIDGNFDVYGNGNFFINSVDWAAEQEDLLNLTTRPRTERIFTPPTETWRFLLLVLVIVIVIPGMVVFFGVSAWFARRKRG
ncbi:MAG: GldG family protein [Anaerolineales bacterium]|uniref:GldG family protein n=1 Tax=Candidatus Villigracilis vicinus TaxID=3140679 RepID=UPI0031349959|nr:GldG family protein [Anaerolineales bacterium]MBK9779074.1 GldG family protein [Anaerolineales bacterium]